MTPQNLNVGVFERTESISNVEKDIGSFERTKTEYSDFWMRKSFLIEEFWKKNWWALVWVSTLTKVLTHVKTFDEKNFLTQLNSKIAKILNAERVGPQFALL